MRRCAFLTMSDLGGYVVDDELAYKPLRSLGWSVEAVPWQQPGVSWGSFDFVVIRSTWDYQADPDAFVARLAEIEDSGARLENPLGIVRWNLSKTYLRDLAARGVTIVPTLWRDRLLRGGLASLFARLDGPEIVVKPVVSANAEGAFRLDHRKIQAMAGEVEAYFSDRALMVQPLVQSVLDEGEYSLVYLNGRHSHTILKTPRPGDFRVQEEHGGFVRPVVADDALLQAGAELLATLDQAPLYARADFVRANDGDSYWLMELELVEPSLYLRMDPEAPERFARALDDRVGRVEVDSDTQS